jgi:hypothetical protein
MDVWARQRINTILEREGTEIKLTPGNKIYAIKSIKEATNRDDFINFVNPDKNYKNLSPKVYIGTLRSRTGMEEDFVLNQYDIQGVPNLFLRLGEPNPFTYDSSNPKTDTRVLYNVKLPVTPQYTLYGKRTSKPKRSKNLIKPRRKSRKPRRKSKKPRKPRRKSRK